MKTGSVEARWVPWLLAAMGTLAAEAGVAAPQSPREEVTSLVVQIQRADYEGDRAALERLYQELSPFAGDEELGTVVGYWRGFALWRRALNGFNESAERSELEEDLTRAVKEFDDVAAKDPSFVDAKIGAGSCLLNLVFLNQQDAARVAELLGKAVPLLREAAAAEPDNPRLLWVQGSSRWYQPLERGGGQEQAIATYEKGLDALRERKKIATRDSLMPSWGEPELLMNLAWSHLNRTAADPEAAERYARSALALVPHWHYVKNILLPQIQAAVPVASETISGTTPAGLFYEASGSGDPVVFLHAFSLDRRMWEPQIAAFEGRFRVIRYDLRGHGRSVAPNEPYTGYDDLRDLLDILEIERATLVGLSAGAELAINFAIAHPDRVSRVVLAGPGLGGHPVPPLPWLGPVFEAAGAGDAEGAAKLWAQTPIMTMRSNEDATETVTSLVMENWRLWTYRRTEQPLSPPAAGRLSEIECPVLVVVGDEDLLHIKEVAGVLAGGIGDAKVVTIPGAGHIVNLDTPEAFNEAIAAFLGVRSER